jgi:hypothetical protein
MVLLAALAFAGTPQGSFQKSYSVGGPVDLEVLTRSGDITIHPGPAGTVTISGKIFVGDHWFSGSRQSDIAQIEKNPPIQQNGNSIRVDYVGVRNIAVSYEITAPADTAVRTHTGSGDQTIEGMRQSLELESGSGDIRLRDVSGPIHARTGSGNLETHQVSGPIQAEAGSGDIVLSGAMTGPWTVRTGSGNVRVALPPQANFELDASTGSGEVSIDHPLTMTVQGHLQSEHHKVHGTVGKGGPVLAVHTGSGDVHIQ